MVKQSEKGEGHCYREYFKKIGNKLPRILKNPVLQEFLEAKEHKEIFYESLESLDESSLRELDRKFKEFYRINRIERYISGLIKRYAIDYDKRVKLRNSRFQLIMDKPINTSKEDSSVTMRELIPNKGKNPVINLIEKEEKRNFIFDIKNPCLYKAIHELSLKQREILYLYYKKGLNNKEISKYYGQTEQNISYWHKKTLKELRSKVELELGNLKVIE